MVFEGDSADTWEGKFPLVSMGGRANGQACADGERGPSRAVLITSLTQQPACFRQNNLNQDPKGNTSSVCTKLYIKVLTVSVTKNLVDDQANIQLQTSYLFGSLLQGSW
jgi:hypothetical protein